MKTPALLSALSPPRWIGGVFLLLLLALPFPAIARPQVLVVIADHLTLSDVTRPDLPNLTRLIAHGRMALMSPGLAQGTDPIANVYASLGAGDSIHAGDISQGRLAIALRQSGVKTALVGNADGDDTGEYRPMSCLLPFADVTRTGQDDGTIPDPVACGGKRVDAGRFWAQTQTALDGCDFVVVHDGDFARIERENRQGDLLPKAYAWHRRQALVALDDYLGLVMPVRGGHPDPDPARWLMLVTPTPPLVGQGAWDRLTPFLQLSPSPGQSGQTLSLACSDTTQTIGLVSVRDLAPTVLYALGIPIPVQMTGAVIGDAPRAANAEALPRLRRLDRLTRLNQDAQSPLFWCLGFGAGGVIFAGLCLFLSGRMAMQTAGLRWITLYAMRLLSAWPLALLLAPLTDPHTLGGYFSGITLLTVLIAFLPTPSIIYGLTAAVLIADGLTGTRLVSESVLSAYALSGIRFYGIGNEYMGLLIGGALLAAAGAGDRKHGFLSLSWFAFVVFVLSYPQFGAKAGGAITATATFVLAWRGLSGLSVNWKHGVGGILAGFLLVFLWALIGHWLPGERHTHIASAVDAVGQGRLGYIAGVALRKIALAARVFLHPGTLVGVLGLMLMAGFVRAFLRRPVVAYLAGHPRFRAVWLAGLWGCLIAVLFNDSGIVAAILLLTSLSVTLLHGLYQECALLPSMSAKSESASPCVTL